MRGGFVETNIPFGSRVVEYGVRFRDGKILAIDSKFPATKELEMVNGDGISEEEKARITRGLVNAVTGRIDEVAGYIDPGSTLPFAVIAIPDSLMEYSPQFVGEASKEERDHSWIFFSALPRGILPESPGGLRPPKGHRGIEGGPPAH